MTSKCPLGKEHQGRLFAMQKCGEIDIMTFGPRGPLQVKDLDEVDRLWECLGEHGRDYTKKVLLVVAAPGSLSPTNVDEFLDSIRRDLTAMGPLAAMSVMETEVTRADNAHRRFVQAVRNIHSVVIAAITGECDFSFFGPALACDYRIATENTVFVNRLLKGRTMPGVLPWFLSRFLGHAAATEILLEGRSLTVHEAYNLRLVNKVVPDDELDIVSVETARRYASLPRPTLCAIKKSLNIAGTDLDNYLSHCGVGFRSYLHSITAAQEDR